MVSERPGPGKKLASIKRPIAKKPTPSAPQHPGYGTAFAFGDQKPYYFRFVIF